jgi:hypothetical protein
MSAKPSLLQIVRSRAGIEGLFVFGWTGTLALILVSFVALFFAFGFWWVYWRAADMDTMVIYEAFLQNDGLPQLNFDHPGYLTILLLGGWFKLLHTIGLLPVHALSELPPETDTAASAAAWMLATQAARLLSLGLAMIFVGGFAILLGRWLKDWRIAALATFALAYSGGLMMEARIVRTELIPAGLAYSALLILLLAARAPRWRVLLVAIASLFAALAMQNKIQILFPLLTFPPILFFLAEQEEQGAPPAANTWLALAVSVIAAVALTIAAAPIVSAGLFDPAAMARRSALFGTGLPIYQSAIALWVFGWLIAFACKHRIGAIESVAAMAALVAGAALGLLALDIRFAAENAVVVMNPFERMLEFATLSDPRLGAPGAALGAPMLQSLASGALLVLARATFVLRSSARPTIFLEWAVFAMMVFAWRRGERRAVGQAALLIAAGAAIDLAGTLRGLKGEYFIMADPLVILAAAWLLVRMPALQTHRLAFPVGAALIAVTVAVGMAEPVKHSFKRDIPTELCDPHFDRTARIGHFSFCP